MTQDTKGKDSTESIASVALRFFGNPWIGIVGGLASVLGLVLAVYFYFDSIRYPDLVYYVNPGRAIVVKQGTTSRLTVSIDGKAISQDVTATQIAIWNRGKEPIRRHAILQSITIRTDANTPILEATIRKKSREVVQLELNQSKIATGELEISWNVLENGDGGVVQVVYAGGPNVGIHASGVIEGQPAIKELRYSGTIKSPAEQMQRERRSIYVFLANGLMAVFMLVLGIAKIKSKGTNVVGAIGYLLPPLVIMAVTVYMFITLTVPDPPFGIE